MKFFKKVLFSIITIFLITCAVSAKNSEGFIDPAMTFCSINGGAQKTLPSLSSSGQINFFFSNLLSTDYWPARWHCGQWTSFHGWLYILSDMTIFLAYFTIPIALALFMRKKRNIPFKTIFLLFALFILTCGITHMLDASMFWWPVYGLSAFVKLLTALISVITAFALVRILPVALTLKSSEELNIEVSMRKESEKALKVKLVELERINKLIVDRELKMIGMKKEIEALRAKQ